MLRARERVSTLKSAAGERSADQSWRLFLQRLPHAQEASDRPWGLVGGPVLLVLLLLVLLLVVVLLLVLLLLLALLALLAPAALAASLGLSCGSR